ncbi:hypothetical protein [Streptomyces cyaneofuscatus]
MGVHQLDGVLALLGRQGGQLGAGVLQPVHELVIDAASTECGGEAVGFERRRVVPAREPVGPRVPLQVGDGNVATEFDLPGSTRPLNQLPLYQHPSHLFPGYPAVRSRYRPGDFPIAEKAHLHPIKLPVWHREQDLKLADQYVSAARKVSEHHKELL